MTPRVGTIGRICIAHWYRGPTVEDINSRMDAIAMARRAVGLPLLLVAIFPRLRELPDKEARAEIFGRLSVFERLIESHYIVLPGGTIGDALLRGGLAMVTASFRNPVTIVATLDAALEQICPRLGVAPAAVIREAGAQGLLDGYSDV